MRLPVALLETRQVAAAAEHVETIAVHGGRAARSVATIVLVAPAVLVFPHLLAGGAIEGHHVFNAAARAERVEPSARRRRTRSSRCRCPPRATPAAARTSARPVTGRSPPSARRDSARATGTTRRAPLVAQRDRPRQRPRRRSGTTRRDVHASVVFPSSSAAPSSSVQIPLYESSGASSAGAVIVRRSASGVMFLDAQTIPNRRPQPAAAAPAAPRIVPKK